jgi:two-component system, NarL family, nitrate/nitrite response regulator NarL
VNTVAICDTEPVAVEGLRSLITAAEGMRVVAAENSLTEGLEAIRELMPDVVILDKAFGLQVVVETLRDLRVPESGVKAIVWGTTVSDGEALRLLNAGAMGVARKTASLDCLLECLSTVASGFTWMEEALIQSAEAAVRNGRSPLTTRELQVMDLVERGMTNRDIGVELGIRTGTVKIHLKHIFEKTGIRGRYGLALCGLKEKSMLLASLVM